MAEWVPNYNFCCFVTFHVYLTLVQKNHLKLGLFLSDRRGLKHMTMRYSPTQLWIETVMVCADVSD